MSLYQLERDGDTDELVEILQRSGKADIRRRAAEILGKLAEDRKEADVLEAEPQAEEPADEELVVQSLDGDPEEETAGVVETLVETADEDPDQAVRAAAIDALDQHGQAALERLVARLSNRDLEAAADWVAARAFVGVLEDEQPELRMAAATGLGRVGDGSVVPKLVERLSDSDSRVRARTAQACGRIGDPRAVEPLSERLHDADADVRQAAANALGEIGTDPALTALIRYAEDDNESVRRIVVDALGHFGSLKPVDTLVEALTDEYDVIRKTAMFSLVEILSNAPPQQSHEVREGTADKLKSATADEVVPPLSEILRESSGAPERRNAAWLLGRVVSSEYRELAQDALVEALDDDDGMTAQFASTSLAELGGEKLESRLLELAQDDDASTKTRSKALFVLGKIGGETSREELGSFVDTTEDDQLREQAFSALSKLGGVGAGDIR